LCLAQSIYKARSKINGSKVLSCTVRLYNSTSISTPLPLQVLRRNGFLNFILPLPNREKCSFPLYPHETVRDLIIDIREEDRETSNIEIKDAKEVNIAHSTLISDLVKSPFIISINDKEYSVVVGDNKDTTMNVVGTPEIDDLIGKSIFQTVLSRMKKDPHLHHITYGDYLKLCESYGLKIDQANEYIRALHISGVVFHFHRNVHLKDYIFLKPETVTSALTKTFGIKFRTHTIPEILAEFDKILPQYLPLNNRKNELDKIAKNKAQWFMRGGLLYLFVQSSILAHMVWVDYSWGVMEPVTYFVFLTTLIGGLCFFIISNEDFTYNALEQRQINKALKKLYTNKNMPFNWKKWNELHVRVTELKGMLEEVHIPKQLRNVEDEKVKE